MRDTPIGEAAFRQLVASPAYASWAAASRARWEAQNLVWYHGENENGRSVWGSKRPHPELEKRLRERGQFRWMRRDVFLAELAAAKEKKR